VVLIFAFCVLRFAFCFCVLRFAFAFYTQARDAAAAAAALAGVVGPFKKKRAAKSRPYVMVGLQFSETLFSRDNITEIQNTISTLMETRSIRNIRVECTEQMGTMQRRSNSTTPLTCTSSYLSHYR